MAIKKPKRSPKKPKHSPDCIACTDPQKAREQRSIGRAYLIELSDNARSHRTIGDELRKRTFDTGLTWQERRDLWVQMRFHYGAANAIGQRVMTVRAAFDRVEAAHPGSTS